MFIGKITFILLLFGFSFLIFRRIKRIKANIFLGRPISISKDPKRWKNLLLLAFAQKKMFKNWIPALFHFFIYIGFILINLEVLEIIIDGIFGTHRVFAPILGNFYSFMISFFEILAVLVLLSCIVFLVRRNVMKIDRFQKIELIGWPAMDANLILLIESILMIAILYMNASDLALQQAGHPAYLNTGTFFISNFLLGTLDGLNVSQLILLERTSWWFHIIGIFAFALYVTYSKHLHIFLAFPNTYFGKIQPKGQMDNLPEVTHEVKLMLGLPVENKNSVEGFTFGARDVTDLNWKNILDAYSCTECGRCTAECPANMTGKKLSPRKIMMDTRDRAEELGNAIHKKDSPALTNYLLGEYISKEEINACTSCNACVEACPVSINPLDIILQMRRYVAMEESSSPASWNSMYQNIETNFAPWKFSAQDRFNWAQAQNKTN